MVEFLAVIRAGNITGMVGRRISRLFCLSTLRAKTSLPRLETQTVYCQGINLSNQDSAKMEREMLRNSCLITLNIFALASFALASDYDKCVMEKIQDAKTETASRAILHLCKEMTTPKKCRREVIYPQVKVRIEEYKQEYAAANKNRYGFYMTENSKEEKVYERIYQECIQECERSSIFDRHFGECKTDY